MQILFQFLQFLVGIIKPPENVQETYSIDSESWRARKHNQSLSGVHEEGELKKATEPEQFPEKSSQEEAEQAFTWAFVSQEEAGQAFTWAFVSKQ